MRRVVLFAAVLVVSLAWPAAASAIVIPANMPIFEFSKSGPGAASDSFQSLSVSAGGLYVCGTMNSATHGADAYVARLSDSHGWAHRYDGPAHSGDYGEAIVACPSGGVYVAFSSRTGAGNSDIVVARYGPGGKRLWARTTNETPGLAERLTALSRCPSGGVYAVGTTGSGSGDADAILYRFNAFGNQRLFVRFGALDGQDQGFNDCAVDSYGRIAVCGAWGTSFNGAQFWVALLTTSGAVKWESRDGTLFDDDARLLVVDSKDRVTVTGTFRAGGDTRDELVVRAFTAAGIPRWGSNEGSADGNVRPFGMACRGSSNVWVCGEKELPGFDWAGLVLGWNLATP